MVTHLISTHTHADKYQQNQQIISMTLLQSSALRQGFCFKQPCRFFCLTCIYHFTKVSDLIPNGLSARPCLNPKLQSFYLMKGKKSFFFGHYIIKQYFCYTFFSFICRQYIKKEIIMEGIYIIFAGVGIVALALYLWSSYTKSGRKWLESL